MSDKQLTIETSDGEVRFICGDCKRPFMVIANGEIQILSKHGSAQHENTLSFAELELAMGAMWRQSHPPQRW